VSPHMSEVSGEYFHREFNDQQITSLAIFVVQRWAHASGEGWPAGEAK